ncbi:helix-turn-helix transcriptional regulator [Aequorivita viscosa]|nr:helix-turn-helix transcriptional regulator [Aequorivita viscosa]
MENRNKILYQTIGGNISLQRKKKNLGQEKLAKLISLSRSSLANIETGNHQPSIFTIYEICQALECEITDLIPTVEGFVTSTTEIEEKFVDIYNSLQENTSEKNLLIFKKLFEKNKK